ncbi:ABC transporter substrate-binding protein [Mesorhizobium microcysteis]|uniref:ABC transporter substrate-binding protein n=1 Tax=Neoaquamicrobium microcysteis TaxID=2682781 RepID=A0A5D4GQV5_9HYPH|nr:extracellular solute-binding protein [Mesorhizobium microcysteis]TYR29705.1 ABC transporter substrate-binding protein [Mesorhizobium microcysteis]
MGFSGFRTLAATALAAVLVSASGGIAGAVEWRTTSSLINPDAETETFERYDHVNPDAPKGGQLNTVTAGTFDSFNPFIVRGTAAAGLNYFGGLLWDTLMQQSLSDPGTSHALIADAFKYPDDYSSATYRIDERARWHDGEPITAEDVVWSFDMLKQHSQMHNRYYANVTEAVAISEREVEFKFDQTGNRELPHIMGDLPVLPKHWWEGTNAQGQKRDFTQPTLEPPLGSGAYRIDSFRPGSDITWTRVEDYWAAELPVNVGRYNFDRRRYTYIQDDNAAWQAFTKGGLHDIRAENRASRWANEYNFPAFERGDVLKRTYETTSGEPMQGFTLNTRRPQFQDRRVREALTLAYDFESLNRVQFHGLYARTNSFFQGGELASSGLPQGLELEILETVRDEVPPEVFTEEFTLPVYDSPQAQRLHLRRASELLAEAGWRQQGGRLFNEKGEPFRIEFLSNNPDSERTSGPYINTLRRLGIDASLRIIDPSQYVNRVRDYDYDIITGIMMQSQSPGNEQREFWSSQAADMPDTRNYAGIKNPAVDKLVDRVIFAKDREELVAATHALDRVLLWGYYYVPQYHNAEIWIAYWNKFGIPETQPSYVGVDIDSWWILQDREAEIDEEYADEVQQ